MAPDLRIFFTMHAEGVYALGVYVKLQQERALIYIAFVD